MPAALPIALGVSAVGSVAGAAIGAKGAKNAANAQAAAADQAAQVQREIYYQTRADYGPYRQVGYSALGKLAQLYGVQQPDIPSDVNATVPTGGATAFNFGMTGTAPGAYTGGLPMQPASATGTPTSSGGAPDYGGFFTSPGYQFRVDQAMKAIERGASARGGLRSPATSKAIGRYISDYVAGPEFTQYASRLAQLAGIGQAATGETSAAGQNYATGAGNAAMAAGNARASGYVGKANAVNAGIQGFGTALNYGVGYGLFGGAGGGASPSVAPANDIYVNPAYGGAGGGVF